MRNLKKILALVLALVMSLSLMVTAGASSFQDVEDDNDYSTAIDVLSALKVIRGYEDGTFRPDGTLSRAEAATLFYHIATGDVDDEYVDNYTYMASNKFTDLTGYGWAAGYINYCQNAGIVIGTSATTFAPGMNVTGYQLMVMMLRTLGYNAYNEFTGAGWELKSAAKCEELGMLKNIKGSGDFGVGASRAMTAEILFQGMLQNTVKPNAVATTGYVKDAETLGYQELKLEEVTGVVTANEWADLDATSPLAEGKTKLVLDDGTSRTLDWSAGSYEDGVKIIGKTHDAYIQDGKTVLTDLVLSSKNDVKDNEGAEAKVSDLKGDLKLSDATTKYYGNFDPMQENYSDYRIEFNVRLVNDSALKEFDMSLATLDLNMDKDATVSSSDYKYAYTKVLKAGDKIADDQLDIIEAIFAIADDSEQSLGIEGSVYVGTKSANTRTDESDSTSFKTFKSTYIDTREAKIISVGNGNWLQVIDNNGDGTAEYVMQVKYVLDKIVDSVKDKDEKTTNYFNALNIKKFTPVAVGNGYNEALGKYYLYATIDGKAYIHDVEPETATFKAVSYKDETATDVNDKVWEQSDIDNQSGLPQTLANVDDYVAYQLYLDDYGYVRAYYAGTNYALVTEIYPTTDRNHSFVVNEKMTAEFVLPIASNDANQPVAQEKNLVNTEFNKRTSLWNSFILNNWWPALQPWENYKLELDHNYLKPATEHLGTSKEADQMTWNSFTWDGNDFVDDDEAHSWTNVAKYTMVNDTDINLFSATTNSDVNVKNTVDYIPLELQNVSSSTALFNIAKQNSAEDGVTDSTDTVRAGKDTLFYVVGANGEIRQYIGYNKLPALTVAGNKMHAMYAVAQNISADREKDEYWMADVIVIEVQELQRTNSVALIYSNDSKTSGTVKYLQAIDAKRGQIEIIPNHSWAGQWNGEGFYYLYDVQKNEDGTYSADINRITDYDAAGIYLGVVTSVGYTDGEYARASYIDAEIIDTCYYDDLDTVNHVNWDGEDAIIGTAGSRGTAKNLNLSSVGNAWKITDNGNNTYSADTLLMNNSANQNVKRNDRIIWVANDRAKDYGEVGFIVDMSETKASWLDKAGKTSNTSISYAIATQQYEYFTSYHHADLTFLVAPMNGVAPQTTAAVAITPDRQSNAAFMASSITVTTADGKEVHPTYNYVKTIVGNNVYWAVGYNLHNIAGDHVVVTVKPNTRALELLVNAAKADENTIVLKYDAAKDVYTADVEIPDAVAAEEAVAVTDAPSYVTIDDGVYFGLKSFEDYLDTSKKYPAGMFTGNEPEAPEVTEYAVTVDVAEDANGDATVEPEKAAAEAEVTITAVPEEGYVVDEVTVTPASEDVEAPEATASEEDANVYTFTMPACDVTVTVTFKEDDGGDEPDPVEPTPVSTTWVFAEDETMVEEDVEINTYPTEDDGFVYVSADELAEALTEVSGGMTDNAMIVDVTVNGDSAAKVEDEDGNVSYVFPVSEDMDVQVVWGFEEESDDPGNTGDFEDDKPGDIGDFEEDDPDTQTLGTLRSGSLTVASKLGEKPTGVKWVWPNDSEKLNVKVESADDFTHDHDTETVSWWKFKLDIDSDLLSGKKLHNAVIRFEFGPVGGDEPTPDDPNTDPVAATGLKAVIVANKTTGAMEAAIYSYKPNNYALDEKEIADALSAASYKGEQLSVSADDVDLDKMTAKNANGAIITLLNKNRVGAYGNANYSLYKVTYPAESGKKEIYVEHGKAPIITDINSKRIMVKPATTTPFLAAGPNVIEVNHGTPKTALPPVSGDVEYATALELELDSSNGTTISSGVVTIAGGSEKVQLGWLSSSNVFAIRSTDTEVYIAAGAKLAFDDNSDNSVAYGKQIVVTTGSTKTNVAVEKNGSYGKVVKTGIVISEDMATAGKVKVKLEVAPADIPVYVNDTKLELKNSVDGQYIYDVSETGAKYMVKDVSGVNTLVAAAVIGTDGRMTYTADAADMDSNGDIKLYTAHKLTYTANSDIEGVYPKLDSYKDEVEGAKIEADAYVRTENDKNVVYVQGQPQVILGVAASAAKNATMELVEEAPAPFSTATAKGIWKVELTGDLNTSDIKPVVKVSGGSLEVEMTGTTSPNSDGTPVAVSNLQLGSATDFPGAVTLTKDFYPDTTDTMNASNYALLDVKECVVKGTQIMVTMHLGNGTEIVGSGSSPKQVGLLTLNLKVADDDYTMQVPVIVKVTP